MKWQLKRKLSAFLAAALALSSLNMGPFYAAEDDTRKIIVGFEALKEKYALQSLPIGADEEDIKFPSSIWVDMIIEKGEDADRAEASVEAEKILASRDIFIEETQPSEENAETEKEEAVFEDEPKADTAEEGAEEEVEKEPEEGVKEEAKEEPEEEVKEEAKEELKKETKEEVKKEIKEGVKEEAEEEAKKEEKEEVKEGAEEKAKKEAKEEVKEEVKEEAEKELKEEPKEDVGEFDKEKNENVSQIELTVINPAQVGGDASNDLVLEDSTTSGQLKTATISQAEAVKEDKKDTDKKTVKKKIKEIEWELNLAESTEQEFTYGTEGIYVYEPVLPSEYELAPDLDLPQIKVIVEDKTAGVVLTAEAGDYIVTVSAGNEVFPEGVRLSAKLIENEAKTKKLKEALEELEGETDIADEELIYFDISVLDEDGNEVQPDNEKGNVTISFKHLAVLMEDSEEETTQDYQIYHMDEKSQTIEKKDTTVEEQAVLAEMEHFSPVIVRTGISKTVKEVSTIEALKEALLETAASTITVTENITVADVDPDPVTLGANHTLIIPNGKTLTITGKINSYNKSSSKTFILTIQGQGEVLIKGTASDCLRGNINLGGGEDDSITVRLITRKSSIRTSNLNVKKGAVIEVDASDGSSLINVEDKAKLTVESGGSINIKNFKEKAIDCKGIINIKSGGTVAINSTVTSGVVIAGTGELTIESGGVLTSTEGGSINLTEGSKVQCPANLLSDQGKAFASAEKVTVAAADALAAEGQLTEGLYVWNGSKFAKKAEGPVTVEVSTIEQLKEALLADADSTINIMQNITVADVEPAVTLGANHTLKIPQGKTLTITGKINSYNESNKKTFTLAIQGQGEVLIQGTASDCLRGNIRLGGGEDDSITVLLKPGKSCIRASVLDVDKGATVVVDSADGIQMINVPVGAALNVKDKGRIEIKSFGSNAIHCAGTVNIENGGTINIDARGTGINLAKGTKSGAEMFGKLNIAEGGVLTSRNGGCINLIKDSKVQGMAGLLSDQGKEFASMAETTVAASDVPAADGKLTEGIYVWDNGRFIKSAKVSTNLTNGILTLSSEKEGGEGWYWNPEKGVLDLNGRFKGNKQIRFAQGISATIKLNDNLTITPDPGQSAITAYGNLTITATGQKRILTAAGKIETQGNIVINGYASVDGTAGGSDSALYSGESITISGTAVVTTAGRLEALGDIILKDTASVSAAAESPGAALSAGKGITVSGTAKVTAVNQGTGPAMNKAPDTTGYTKLKLTASTEYNGRPPAEYREAAIGQYKYIRIQKERDASEIPVTVDEIEAMVNDIKDSSDKDTIDLAVEQIMKLSLQEKKKLKPEAIEKLDSLLQETTGIELIRKLDIPWKIEGNKQVKKAEIRGALLAAGIMTSDLGNRTKVEFELQQKDTESGAAVTFDCSLRVNGREVSLNSPVTVVVELPPEYIPVTGYRIHHVGTGVDEWLDFIYDGADNTAEFQTSSFSTFSIKEQWPSGNRGGSSGGGSGSGGGGGGGPRLKSASARSGKWIQDAVGWWYQNADNTYPKDGWFQLEYSGKKEWYYFDKNGYMAVGWVFSDGKWYYLSQALDGSNGRMLTGWQLIDGKWYYLNEAPDGTRGARLADTWVGEYYLNQEGIWEEGKKKQEEK